MTAVRRFSADVTLARIENRRRKNGKSDSRP